jgi:hypothetical protein
MSSWACFRGSAFGWRIGEDGALIEDEAEQSALAEMRDLRSAGDSAELRSGPSPISFARTTEVFSDPEGRLE